MRFLVANEDDEFFVRLNALRGVFAIVVLLSHVWGYTGLVFLVPFNKIVTIAVTFFFFLSGYGMLRSSVKKEKKSYIIQIFTQKIPFLIWMAALAYVFAFLLELIIKRAGIEDCYYTPISIKNLFITTNWYVYELIGFYIVFAAIVGLVKEQYQILSIFLISIIAFVLLFYSGLVEAYYNSIIGFSFGMLCFKYQLNGKIKEKWWITIAAFIIFVLAFLGMFLFNKDAIGFAVIRNLAAVASIILVTKVVQYINFIDAFFKYLSRISPEIYFYHMPLTMVLAWTIKNPYIYLGIVFCLTIVVARIMNIVNVNIRKIVQRSKKNEA